MKRRKRKPIKKRTVGLSEDFFTCIVNQPSKVIAMYLQALSDSSRRKEFPDRWIPTLGQVEELTGILSLRGHEDYISC